MNPAIQSFLQNAKFPLMMGQITIDLRGKGFEIRHQIDRDKSAETLRLCDAEALREMAARDAGGGFRPLKSAPTLQRGWRSCPADSEALWQYLNILYPGALGDWFAFESGKAHPVSFRELVARQTGMYRNAALLDEDEARLITGSCFAKHCLKKRQWKIESSSSQSQLSQLKSSSLQSSSQLSSSELSSQSLESLPLICLEPCQVFLELARRTAKMKQESLIPLKLPRSEIEALLEILENHPAQNADLCAVRAGDFSSSTNPLRIELLLQRVRSQFSRQKRDGKVE